MKLEKLLIEEIRWGNRAGEYNAHIKFRSERGAVECALDSEQINRVLSVVADALVATSKDIADNLTAEVITSSPMLEHDEP